MATKKKSATKKTTVKAASVAPTKKTATKKTATKKTATKKAAVKKTAAPKAAAASTGSSKTTVIAQVDVGWGNSLYIRGEGGGLSWEKGILMDCNGDNEWVWSTATASKGLEFKLLVNDELWCDGENLCVKAGGTSISQPTF